MKTKATLFYFYELVKCQKSSQYCLGLGWGRRWNMRQHQRNWACRRRGARRCQAVSFCLSHLVGLCLDSVVEVGKTGVMGREKSAHSHWFPCYIPNNRTAAVCSSKQSRLARSLFGVGRTTRLTTRSPGHQPLSVLALHDMVQRILGGGKGCKCCFLLRCGIVIICLFVFFLFHVSSSIRSLRQ
ncbi:hypothetical protein IWX90DRAFT_197275 [Phyllosticta citrichinensis]|uniref:Transmembrane protein n=1 Tax=Phyllosticta citrichinensis TaxID=1130410 RepID=A0ABR1XXU4_9PEZI